MKNLLLLMIGTVGIYLALREPVPSGTAVDRVTRTARVLELQSKVEFGVATAQQRREAQ